MLMTNTELSRRRVFGVGVLISGIVLLAVALIMGLEFPEYVTVNNIEDLCILDSSHPKYNIWVQDSYRTRYNRIYYWEVTNKDDFLYKGVFPQYQQRGPYIYKEKQEKVNVRFLWSGGHNIVTFYQWKKQEYDRLMTQSECGEQCLENDEITVFNENYFREMSAFGSDVKLAWNKLPAVLQSCYRDLTTIYALYNTTFIYKTFGVIHQNLTIDLPDPSCSGFLPFGQWLSNNDTDSKQALLSGYPNITFDAKDMSGLYTVLMNQVLLGSDQSKLTSSSNKAHCDSLLGSYNLSHTTAGVNLAIDKNGLLTFDEDFNLQCGLIHWLNKYNNLQLNGDFQETALNVSYIIQQYLCVNSSSSCLQFPLTSHAMFTYTSAIVHYIYDHLIPFSIHKSVILNNDDIIITSKQSDLALGFIRIDNSSGTDTVFVPGILEIVINEENVARDSKHITLLNCYDQLYAQSNFMWYAYENQRYSNISQFPNASAADREVYGIRENYPPLLDITPCGAHNILRENFTMFIPEFWRTMVYKRQKNCQCKINGIRVNTFVFNESNVQKEDKFIFEDGIQDMSGTNGYLSWTSLPHFLFANESLISQYGAKPDSQLHLPNISIEPITGNVWAKSIKFQQNVGILPEYIEADRFNSLMINATNVPLPVYWLDQSFQYNDDGVDDHHSRVGKLMSASCGGVISLSIISSLVVLLGASIALCKWRSSRVAPEPTEQESGQHFGPIW